jgi:hypothetical protein
MAAIIGDVMDDVTCKSSIVMFIVFCGGVCAQDGKARYEIGTKNCLFKNLYFQPIVKFQKLLHYTKAMQLSCLLFSDRTICEKYVFFTSAGEY